MHKRFIDTPNTKTDDFGYLLEVISQVIMPYFLVVSGIGVAVYGGSNFQALEKESRTGLINIGYGLTSAALIFIDPRKRSSKENTSSDSDGVTH